MIIVNFQTHFLPISGTQPSPLRYFGEHLCKVLVRKDKIGTF